MPRIARAVAAGFPHHITQRGNYRQNIFEHEDDYETYLDLLKTYAAKHALSIWAYCLMSNHVHLVAVPMKDGSLGNAFRTLNMRYSQHFNSSKNAGGHLWQGRFYSTALDERHLYAAVRYAENNPVRAAMVQKAEDYRWSSARGHADCAPSEIIADGCPLIEGIKDWRAYLAEPRDGDLEDTLRRNTQSGRPCGNGQFIELLEGRLKRSLTVLSRGRPKK